MKVGIYGGTFNPPHNGHVITAVSVLKQLALDTILFIPSYINPLKQEGEENLSAHRLEMIRIVAKKNPQFEVSDYEIAKKSTSYTISTMEYLRKSRPNDEFCIIVGMDNYLQFHRWKNPEKLLHLASLVVMTRPQFERKHNKNIQAENIQFINVPMVDISSTDIRHKIKSGLPVTDYLPSEIISYIIDHKLYQ